jgi:RHS repeat-associated protein
LTRTYQYEYWHQVYNPAEYIARYIVNRLFYVAVTPAGGAAITLAYRSYDMASSPCGYMINNTLLVNHDWLYDTSVTYRGNATRVSGLNYGDTTCAAYDIGGVPYYTADAYGHSASIQTNPDSNYSLPGVITPNGNSDMATSATYATSWAVTSMTGPNGAQGTTTYDSYGRPTQTQIPDGAVTTYTYTYSPGASTQTATVNGRWKTTTLDGFGRTIRVQTGNGSTTVSTVDTQYAPCACSPLGKLWRVSQPYAPGATPVWTTYTYDGSGRTLTVTAPDGASTTWYTYAGTYTTVHDPAGKGNTSVVDAFGNLVALWETDPALGNVSAYYTYTPVNQLATVTMIRGTVTQTRTFVYSGWDMVSATNPENGTVTYTYDGNHHVTSRTDNLGQQTQYDHDAYGRVTQVRYYWANGTEVNSIDYYYDGNNPFDSTFTQNSMGRLSAVRFDGEDAMSSSLRYQYSYNAAGRVTGQRLRVGQNNSSSWLGMEADYQWDNEGRMTSLAYPGVSTTAGYQYDANGRMSGMTWDSGSGPQPYASATYGPAGQMLTLSYGAGTETRTYNSLLQLTSQVVPGYLNMTYNYSPSGNNGRITSSVDGVTGESTTYSYDTLNRLSTASNGLWSESYSYDGFGNLTAKSGTGGAPSMTASYDANNHQVGMSYDGNGNLISFGNLTNSWKVGNLLAAQWSSVYPYGGTGYAYDPWGKRTLTLSIPDPYGDEGLNNSYKVDFWGIGGQKLVSVACPLYNGDPQPTCAVTGQNVYFGRKLLVSGGVNVVTDRLGSVRANTQGERFSYYPYGEERTSTVDGRDKFGTYFRDGAGQDYADQRYYNAGVGRFWSADPARGSEAGDPGSWNKYAYVQGDPVNFADRNGMNRQMCDVYSDTGGCVGPAVAPGSATGAPGPDPAAKDPTIAIRADVKNDLNKQPCDQLLGFASASAAQAFFAKISFNEQNNGALQLANGAPAAATPSPAQTLGFGTVNLNMNYNWGNFSQVATSTGGTYNYLGYINRMFGTNMTSEELGTLIIIHELLHQATVPNQSDDESIKAKKAIYNDCIK